MSSKEAASKGGTSPRKEFGSASVVLAKAETEDQNNLIVLNKAQLSEIVREEVQQALKVGGGSADLAPPSRESDNASNGITEQREDLDSRKIEQQEHDTHQEARSGQPGEDLGNHTEGLEGENEMSVASSELDSTEEDESWVSWYCSLKGHEFFCEVDIYYIEDSFNLYGLADRVPWYSEALDIITDTDDFDDEYPPGSEDRNEIEAAAELLYGLVHARFILTAHGLDTMNELFQSRAFGECLKIQCERQALLPIGLSDTEGESSVKTFCCRCHETYLPIKSRNRSLDGAYWGKTFPHLFLMIYPQEIPKDIINRVEPSIYGYRISKKSKYWTSCSALNSVEVVTTDRAPTGDQEASLSNQVAQMKLASPDATKEPAEKPDDRAAVKDHSIPPPAQSNNSDTAEVGTGGEFMSEPRQASPSPPINEAKLSAH